jgi:hypothetical protein
MRAGSTEYVWQRSPIDRGDERYLKRVQITGAWQSERGPGARMCFTLFVFRGIIRCNFEVISRVGGTGGQRPSCILRSLFAFLVHPC